MIRIRFKNEDNGKEMEGEVETTNTIAGILEDLKTEGLTTDGTETFKDSQGNIISKSILFKDLAIHNGDTIIITKPIGNGEFYNESSNTSKDTPPNFKRPESPKTFHQLGIFVLDGSFSMNEMAQGNIKKKDAVNTAMRGVLSIFKKSRKRNNFSFGVIFFGNIASLKLPITQAKDTDENVDYDSTVGHNQNTLVYTGLEKAEELANTFLADTNGETVPRSVVIVVLSDGECHQPDKTIEVANRIKNNASIKMCTTFLSAPNNHILEAEDLMKKIASDPVINFENTYDPNSLRAFFESSMSKIR